MGMTVRIYEALSGEGGGGVRYVPCLSKPVISHIEEEAMLLLVHIFYYF